MSKARGTSKRDVSAKPQNSGSEKCEVHTSSPNERSKSTVHEGEAEWQKACRNEAPLLFDEVINGNIQPKIAFGDWLNSKHAKLDALYPEQPLKAKRAWTALVKTKDFPTKTKHTSYHVIKCYRLIAQCEFIRNSDNWLHMTDSWTGLYEITKLTPDQRERGKKHGLLLKTVGIKSLREIPKRQSKKTQKPEPVKEKLAVLVKALDQAATVGNELTQVGEDAITTSNRRLRIVLPPTVADKDRKRLTQAVTTLNALLAELSLDASVEVEA